MVEQVQKVQWGINVAKEEAEKLARSREASMVLTKLDEAELWLLKYQQRDEK